MTIGSDAAFPFAGEKSFLARIAVSLAFAAWLAGRFGGEVGITFLTTYTLEKSLSVDNLFVFALIFSQTGIPPGLQRRALFWGVAGALVMRALMIGAPLLFPGRPPDRCVERIKAAPPRQE
jgi:hypothetical protein